MKVKVLRDMKIQGTRYVEGSIVQVDEYTASRLIVKGLAEESVPVKTKTKPAKTVKKG